MALKPISVSQLNDYIARVVGTDPLLTNISVKGEVSGVKYHGSGHVYFTLVDSGSKVNCFLPRSNVANIPFQIKDGMELIAGGYINIYKAGGSYSLNIRDLAVSGEGSLAIAFEQMKKRLDAEGLFDPAHKKQLPFFPKKIGIVTSQTGAAVRDILKTIKLRNDVVDVLLFPAQVQGEGAADDIAAAVRFANFRYPELDVLIVGRGGGSAEDLWAFNEEVLARALYDSVIPTISAVGHEIDFSISDMVADVRAATPTAAAQIACPDTGELRQSIEDMKNQLYSGLKNDLVYERLKLDNMIQGARDSIKSKIADIRHQIEQQKLLLEENDPRLILSRGYSIVEDEDGRTITDAGQIRERSTYNVTFEKGSVKMTAAGGEKDE